MNRRRFFRFLPFTALISSLPIMILGRITRGIGLDSFAEYREIESDPPMESLTSGIYAPQLTKIHQSNELQKSAIKIRGDATLCITGLISEIEIRLTRKSKEKYAILKVHDYWGETEVIVFSKVFADAEAILNKEDHYDPILVIGYKNVNMLDNSNSISTDGEQHHTRIVAQKIKPLIDLYIDMSETGLNAEFRSDV